MRNEAEKYKTGISQDWLISNQTNICELTIIQTLKLNVIMLKRFMYWLHWKLCKWHVPMQPWTKISPKWHIGFGQTFFFKIQKVSLKLLCLQLSAATWSLTDHEIHWMKILNDQGYSITESIRHEFHNKHSNSELKYTKFEVNWVEYFSRLHIFIWKCMEISTVMNEQARPTLLVGDNKTK